MLILTLRIKFLKWFSLENTIFKTESYFRNGNKENYDWDYHTQLDLLEFRWKSIFIFSAGTTEATPRVFKSFAFQGHLLSLFFVNHITCFFFKKCFKSNFNFVKLVFIAKYMYFKRVNARQESQNKMKINQKRNSMTRQNPDKVFINFFVMFYQLQWHLHINFRRVRFYFCHYDLALCWLKWVSLFLDYII